jgi:pantoate--beta-alanine ligase
VRLVRTIAEVREHVARARAAGRTVGLVPTMGAFHEGHAELMRAARASCDDVVVSLFVNPAQFNEAADLASYPRSEEQDAAIAESLGVDLLFAPAPEEVYPDGFATTVTVGRLAEVLEGEHRGPEHLAGVCTVVAKLLNIVTPDVAYFGQKDAQQVVVIRRMVRDLDIPVRVEKVPTVRESDGVAMSSRNRLLAPADRARAVALHRALQAAEDAIAAGEREPAAVRAAALAVLEPYDVEAEYLAVVDPDTLSPLSRVNGRALVAVAARVGAARLIDNTLIATEPR